jgi:hypothetical protein
MSIPTTTAGPWPSRAAYFSAAVFIGASGATNVLYGWQKGIDLPTSLVWAGVAGAVAVIFAISWPALIRSLEAKRWSAALMALVALVLAGGSAAWGSDQCRDPRDGHHRRPQEGAGRLRHRQDGVGRFEARAPRGGAPSDHQPQPGSGWAVRLREWLIGHGVPAPPPHAGIGTVEAARRAGGQDGKRHQGSENHGPIACKRVGASYRSGSSTDWVKVKFGWREGNRSAGA